MAKNSLVVPSSAVPRRAVCETLTLVISDTAHGLPQIPGTTFLERPSDSMAAPIGMSDAAIVTKTFRY